jgi:hypothetical protein
MCATICIQQSITICYMYMYVIILSVNRKKIDVDSARSSYSVYTPFLYLPKVLFFLLKHLPPTMKCAPYCVQICLDWNLSGLKYLIINHTLLLTWAGMAWSVQWLAIDWMVQGSNPGGIKIFSTHQDWPWDPPSLPYNGSSYSPGKAARVWH